MKRVALITCQNLPEPDVDQELVLEALRGAGLDARLLAWDDPAGDPGAFDLCVLRSTWDYYHRPDAFLAWVERAASVSKLLNPAQVVRWNIHKRYLERLQAAGVAILPTVWFTRAEAVDLRRTMQDHGWSDVVIKPAVSAGSFRTRRFRIGDLDAGQRFLDDLLRDRDAMVQQYLPAVENGGERALVHIDGELTHVVIKQPRFDGQHEKVSEAEMPTREDCAIAAAALALVDGPLLYARVDVVRHEDRPLLSELELIEPSLFLLQHPPALERFVRAVGAAIP